MANNTINYPVYTDRASFIETYRDIVKIDQNQVIVISLPESSSAAEMISQWIKSREHNIKSSHSYVSYHEYLSANEAIYASILKRPLIPVYLAWKLLSLIQHSDVMFNVIKI